jgi:hypothetical protein
MSLAFLFHYLMLNMFRTLIHPFSGACNLFAELFHVLYCSGTMCVGVTLWFGWGGVVSGFRLNPASGYHTTPAKPQRNTNTHRTRAFFPLWRCGPTQAMASPFLRFLDHIQRRITVGLLWTSDQLVAETST